MSKALFKVGDIVLFSGHRCEVVWVDEPNGTPNERTYTLRIAHRWSISPDPPPIEYVLTESRAEASVRLFKPPKQIEA